MRKFYDTLMDEPSSVYHDNKVHEDEKGKYTIKYTSKTVSCSCHPETCCHFDGVTNVTIEEKIYQ